MEVHWGRSDPQAGQERAEGVAKAHHTCANPFNLDAAQGQGEGGQECQLRVRLLAAGALAEGASPAAAPRPYV